MTQIRAAARGLLTDACSLLLISTFLLTLLLSRVGTETLLGSNVELSLLIMQEQFLTAEFSQW